MRYVDEHNKRIGALVSLYESLKLDIKYIK